jgi:hypothetical protein
MSGIKSSLEEFKEKANKKYNYKYDYSKSVYIKSTNKIIIICKEHGQFLQKPKDHLFGNGCPKCGIEKRNANIALSIQCFIEKANKIHKNKYDYSKSIYKNTSNKIIIICPEHKEFIQKAGVHLQGKGCQKCAVERRVYNIDTFIIRANEIHNYKYDYSKADFFKSSIKTIIICKIHGEFLQSPNKHLMGRNCPKCALNSFPNNDTFIERANQIHNHNYDYSKTNYLTFSKKIIIICKKHGEFSQTPSHHLEGKGCSKCSHIISKSEIQWLNYLNVPNEFRHKVLFVNKKRYNLDAYNPITNTVYEFYGDYWHGNPKVFDQEKIHPIRKISYGELYRKTLEKENVLKNAGYNIVSIWEYDWKELNKELK